MFPFTSKMGEEITCKLPALLISLCDGKKVVRVLMGAVINNQNPDFQRVQRAA